MSRNNQKNVSFPAISGATSKQQSPRDGMARRMSTIVAQTSNRDLATLKRKPKRDFFKLQPNEFVEFEQNDAVIKKKYAQFIHKKFQRLDQYRSHSIDPTVKKAKRLKFENPDARQDYGIIYTQYDEFVAAQDILDADQVARRKEILDQLQNQVQDEFEKVTVPEEDERKGRTLMSGVIEAQKAQMVAQKLEIASPTVAHRRGAFSKKRHTIAPAGSGDAFRELLNKKQTGNISIQNLLNINVTHQRDLLKKINASDLYLPSEKRKLTDGLTTSKLEEKKVEVKTVKFDPELAKRKAERMAAKERKVQQLQELRRKKNRKPPKRRESFSDQLKYGDVANLANPLYGKPTLQRSKTVTKMIRVGRFPIPEVLMKVPDQFDLMIDSYIIKAYNSDEENKWANFKPDIDAPHNSACSSEEIDFESSQSSEEEEIITDDKNKKEKKVKPSKVNKNALTMHGFDANQLMAYPHGSDENAAPFHLLKEELKGEFSNIEKMVNKKIKAEFKEKKLFPDFEHVQMAYESFCVDFHTTPIQLRDYFQEDRFIIYNQQLPDSQVKALCCIIPTMKGLKEFTLNTNKLQDEMGAILVMACFMNPDLKTIKFQSQFFRSMMGQTFYECMQACPKKISQFMMPQCVYTGEHLEMVTWQLAKYVNLQTLDVSFNPMSMPFCKNIGTVLTQSQVLRKLDVSGCKIGYQGTRYIIDGLNRNNHLQYFNFAQNDLSSSVYEFSIKLSKIITRHQAIMHLDLSATGMRKEEVIFVGMSIKHASAVVSIHLSSNNLDYYERIFLRTLIGARTSYHFRNMAAELGAIRSQKERNQIMELKTHDFDNENLRNFVEQWTYIDKQKIGLDDQINKIMSEVDISKIFTEMRKGNKTSAEKDDLILDIVGRINKRTEELDEMDQLVETESERSIDQNDQGNMNSTLNNFASNFMDQNDPEDRNKRDMRDGDTAEDDFFQVQNALKVGRIKDKIDKDAQRLKRAKSAGEMALMFMGINKIAYDMLLENPMTGYMNEIIFCRILGNDDIPNELGQDWRDTSQCYICEKWDKVRIEYKETDAKLFEQNITKLGELDEILKTCVHLQNKKLIKKVPESKIKRMYEKEQKRAKDEKFGAEALDSDGEVDDAYSLRTLSDDKIYTESLLSEKIDNANLKEGHPISAIILDEEQLQKNFVNNFAIQNLKRSKTPPAERMSEESGISQYENLNVMERDSQQSVDLSALESDSGGGSHPDIKISRASKTQKSSDDDYKEAVTRKFDVTQLGLPDSDSEDIDNMQVINRELTKKSTKLLRKKTTMKSNNVRKKTVFYKGQAFVIEEEISVDSDLSSSVHTSEDSMDEDGEGVKDGFNLRNEEKLNEVDDIQAKRDQKLYDVLAANKISFTNLFGRDKIFICASYNDWHPREMQTGYEIKQMRTRIFEIQDMDMEARSKMKSKKKDDNTIMLSLFIPPGKHFFYFIYQNSFIFLSPSHPVVRFKGTNVFLNSIEVKERKAELQQVTLDRNVYVAESQKFKKEMSVWKTFKEDDEEMMKKCLDQDLEYGKIKRLCKQEEDQILLKQMLLKYYLQIKNMFLLMAANSNYPCIGLNDYTLFIQRSQVYDKNLTLASVDINLAATNVSNNKFKNSSERELHRYEFMEVIVRLSSTKFKEPKIIPTYHDATSEFLEKHIIPNNRQVNGVTWRLDQLYNLKCDEFWRKNAAPTQKLFESYLNPTKRYVTMEECFKTCRKAGITISESKINECYVESMMTRVDTMSDLSVLQQMKYVEFIVFIARLSFEIYKSTKQEGIGLHLKCDKVLPPLLETIGVAIIFSFKEDDADEESSDGNSDSNSKSSGSSKNSSKKDDDEDDDDDLQGTMRKSAMDKTADMKNTGDMKGTAGSDIAHVADK